MQLEDTLDWAYRCPFSQEYMGETAENLAEEFQYEREPMDAWAAMSQTRALAAIESGFLGRQIVPIEVPEGRGVRVMETDESPRADATLEKLSRLRPAFREGGKVTAGNSSGVTDGAGFVLVGDRAAMEAEGCAPEARIVDWHCVGVPPHIMGHGPVPAIRGLLEKTGLKVSDIDYFEINEAFTVVNLHAEKQLGIPRDRAQSLWRRDIRRASAGADGAAHGDECGPAPGRYRRAARDPVHVPGRRTGHGDADREGRMIPPVDGRAAAEAAADLAGRSATLWDAFVATAREHGDLPFMVIPRREGRDYAPEGAEITYGEALQEVEHRAAIFRGKGFGPGRRVALMLDNRPEHFFCQLALYAVGASQVPVNPDYLDHELQYLLEHSEADLALGLPHHMERLWRVAGQVGTAAMPEADLADISAPGGAARPAETGRGAEAAIIYTSGTTGRPKGCIIDHAHHFAVGTMYAAHQGRLSLRHGGDRIFSPLPLFHINAGMNSLAAMILTANALIVPDRFHPDTWWRDIVETGATGMHYLGVIPPLMLKREPSPEETAHTLRYGLGAGIDPDLHARFEERFRVPMVEVWGMTETGRFLADCHEPRRIHTRAFGKPSGELEARVVEEDMTDVALGEPGELVVRATGSDPRRGFFRGYLRNDAATDEAWRGGWFHTGDVVTQEPDGMLHFVERRKNIIRRSGENISAAEVENALIGHEAVGAVACLAVPDELRDEEVMACIVPAGPRDEATARAIFDHARDLVAYYKLPGWIAFVDDLPVTGTQKVRKDLIFPDLDDPRDAPGIVDLRPMKKRKR